MYAKIFSQIYDSSLADDYRIRHIFMDLLVLADRDGVVDMTPEAIARRINVPMEALTSALSALSAPDKRSRSPDEDGRRIVLLDGHRNWGWRIVNFPVYHAMRDESARRERNRRCQATYRKNHPKSKRRVSATGAYVSADKRVSAHIDLDIDTDTHTDEDKKPPAGAEPAGDGSKKPRQKKPKEGKPSAVRPPNPHADAFKAAFDEAFPEVGGYDWPRADFVQLNEWRKKHAAVSPEEFVTVAQKHWARGEYTPKRALSIRGLCSDWAQLAAYRGNGDSAGGLFPGRKLIGSQAELEEDA